MARHRNVRNLKHIDYDDDYDIYGQSYEDDYGVSPGTMEHYMYSRSSSKNVDLSSFIPSEATVKEDIEEVESQSTKEIKKATKEKAANNHPEQKQNIINFQTKIKCYTLIRNAVGGYFSDVAIENAAVQFNFDAEKAINHLLTSISKTNIANISTVSDVKGLSNTPPKMIPNAATVALPQRTPRGRRGKMLEKDPSIKKGNASKATVNLTSNDTKAVKVGTNSNTPVKTGFHLSTNSNKKEKGSPVVFDQRRYSDAQINKNDSNSLARLKANSSFSSLNSSMIGTVEGEVTSTLAKPGKNQVNYKKEYENRSKNSKQQLSMVVIGHVDAGKSTMMGHLLFRKGIVSKKVIHKYEQDSKKLGKSSFAFAWVLDETGEERERGVTMDVAHNYFETDNRVITLMDAPGHRDFIPNMITGASQADVAILVVGSSTGEFEAGFGVGGQTREHALLVRSLGVSQLAVAVNKLDAVEWSKERFDDIVRQLKQFLKQAGFRDSDVTYVPVSGLLGENLTDPSQEPSLCSWYKGPSLLQVIDTFRPPQRPIDFPFRFCVNDVYRGQGSGIFLSGKVESGGICPNTKVIVMPAGEKGIIKAVESGDDKGRVEFALSGEHATLVINGIEMNKINKGSVICDVDVPIRSVTRLQARVIVFNIEVPITKGFPVELHYKAVSEPAVFKKLISQLHKTTAEVIVNKPRFLLKGQNAIVEIETARAVCLEEYGKLKEMGRFTLRYGGSTIAACVVTKLL